MFACIAISILSQTNPNVRTALKEMFQNFKVKINGNVKKEFISDYFETSIDELGPRIVNVLILQPSLFFEDSSNSISFTFGEKYSTEPLNFTMLKQNLTILNLISPGNAFPLVVQMSHFSSQTPNNMDSPSFLMLKEKTKPFMVGHRGCGSTYGLNTSESTENTIQSFNRAFKLGVDMVELDVSITNDQKVIVYHDDVVLVNSSQLTISQLSYTSLQNIQHIKGTFLQLGQDEANEMPLFESVLDKTPSSLPINVEIKSPPLIIADEEYINTILRVLDGYPSRSFIISSFSPIICAITARIQANIPVFLLVEKHVEKCAQFAAIEGLSGVVVDSRFFLGEGGSDMVTDIKGMSLYVFVWGDLNNDEGNIASLIKMGVDGIINDRIELLPNN